MLGHDGVSVRVRTATWMSGGLLAVLLGACDPEPLVQLSLSAPVRDAGAGMPSPAGAPANPFSEWEKFECEEIDLVCGSDNQTYSNFCLAARAGVSIVKRGPC